MSRILLIAAGPSLATVACDAQPGDASAGATAGTAQAAPAPKAEGVRRLADDTVVATWDGGQLTYGDLMGQVEGNLIKARVEYLTQVYGMENQALESAVLEALLEAEAKARGMEGPEALLKVEIEDKVPEPTDAEAEAFYPVIARQLRGMPYEAVAPQVKGELLRRKQSEAFGAYVETLQAKYKVANSLPYPDVPRIPVSVDDDPFIGPEDAQITIVQFAEYQCPYCGRGNAAVEQVMEEYEGKVKMVYRDFPLSFHDRAIPAAVAANCAGEQGKYWEMHETLMANQQALSEADLTGYAQTHSLDLDKWNTCRQDPAQVAEVNKDMDDGAAAGVSGTPAFFINGIMLSGAQPFSEFKTIIDRELANAG